MGNGHKKRASGPIVRAGKGGCCGHKNYSKLRIERQRWANVSGKIE